MTNHKHLIGAEHQVPDNQTTEHPTGYAYYDAMVKVEADFPHLSADVKHALAQYDADVATGEITFADNGHGDGQTHPEVWLPSSYVTMAGTTLPRTMATQRNIWDY